MDHEGVPDELEPSSMEPKGRTEVRDLVRLWGLLRGRARATERVSRGTRKGIVLENQKDLAEALGWNRFDLNKAMKSQGPPTIPKRSVPALLRLFNLDYEDLKLQNIDPYALINEPIARFCELARSHDGHAFTLSNWDELIAAKGHFMDA